MEIKIYSTRCLLPDLIGIIAVTLLVGPIGGIPWAFCIALWYLINLTESAELNANELRLKKLNGTESLRRDGIEGVDVKKSLFGMLFGYGDVIVHGKGGKDIVLPYISGADDVASAIRSELEAK